ncbi:MAG: homocysteine biosynthesis protein [bacterium]|nr:homocysteine biosynthesis protein [bacterium]
MAKTYAEINEKIKKGQAVVVTAEEVIEIAEKKGIKRAAQEIDVVTTGTFGPMCSSGAFLNLGHTKPRIKIQKAWLNGVNAYAGLAAVDVYLGVTEIPDDDPVNKIYPGEFKYGGAHVIEELVSGKDVRLKAIAYATDCYPRKEIETWINLKDLNQAYLCNPRNAYQNYNVAVNSSDRVLYTYLGMLLPKFGNANYCSAGQLSPLLNDPFYKTIGIGTRIFLGGGEGYVYWEGTQHTPTAKRTEKGIPRFPAGTIAVLGDLKQMSPKWLKAVSFTGYGVTLSIGIGVPIPILNEAILEYTTVKDEDIAAPLVDYATAYPERKPDTLGEVNYQQLRSGTVKINNKEVPTGGLSSYSKAREIALILKQWIREGKFQITEPVAHLPGPDSGQTFKPLNDRP